MPPKPLPPVDRQTRTLNSFFAPSQSRATPVVGHISVTPEQKSPAKLGSRKRPRTIKKAASFSLVMQQEFPWAVAVEEPVDQPFTACVTIIDSGVTNRIVFDTRTPGVQLQMMGGDELLEVNAEEISFCIEENIRGNCYLCCEKFGPNVPLWTCSKCKIVCCEGEIRVWYSWVPRCPQCHFSVRGFSQRFKCTWCDSDSLLAIIGLHFSSSRRGTSRTPGGQFAANKVMKEHEGGQSSFHNFVGRIYQFLRLNNELILDLVFAKEVLGYLADSRIIDAIRSQEVQPSYTEDMRQQHMTFLKNYIQQERPLASGVVTSLPAVLTSELLEAAYVTAFHVRPASSYTDLCNYVRINLARFGADQLPGTHSSGDMCMAMVRSISWRYHFNDVTRQKRQSEHLQHGDQSEYMYLPWALKWDGYSAGNLAMQGFIWKVLGQAGSDQEFVAQDLLFRIVDTYGIYKDEHGVSHPRNATGPGHFNTFLHAMTVGAFPDIGDTKYEIAPGLDILKSLVHAGMDNGGQHQRSFARSWIIHGTSVITL